MKTILKILGALLGVATLGAAAVALTCVARWPGAYPDVPLPAIAASTDPAVVERGAYLFNAVAACASCHAPVSDVVGRRAGDVIAPKGGFEWHMGPIGTVRSSNITPHPETGVGNQTDAQIARAIRHGVKANGAPALFMFAVGPMSDEDLVALVSYIRTITPVDNAIAPSEISVLGKVLFGGPLHHFAAPHDYADLAPPFVREGAASAERGRYIVDGPGMCSGCHSDAEHGASLEFVGQRGSGRADAAFPDETEAGYEFFAPNLTPDPATGHITHWTLEHFIGRMRAGRVHAGTPMPWESYANLTDADLESIWLYLRSLPPTHKAIGSTRRGEGEAPV